MAKNHKIGVKVKKWRQHLNLKQIEFWRKVRSDITSSQASRYENPNDRLDVPAEYYHKIENILKVPLELLRDPNVQDYPKSLDPWIIYKSKPVADLLPHERLIPVLSKISPDGAYDPADVSASEVLPPTIQEGILGDFFAMKASGEANAPKIESGDTVIFIKNPSMNILNNGDIGLFNLKGAILLRSAHYPETPDNRGLILKTFNPDQELYPRIILREDDMNSLIFLGRAVAIIKYCG